MSFGTAGFGTSPFGGAGGLYIVEAFASSTRSIRVTLSAEPQHSNAYLPGDAYNPNMWSVVRTDTSAPFTVIAVEDYDLPTVFEIFVLEDLPSHLISLKLTASAFLKAADGEFVNATQRDTTFPGILADAKKDVPSQVATRSLVQTDLANPPTVSSDGTGFAGSLKILPGGDYANVSGVELIKKLVLRRLMAKPGDFFHLPNYGLGLRVKGLYNVSQLRTLQTEIERQLKEEPEIEAVKSSITSANDGILTVQLSVRVRSTGENIDLEFSQARGG